MNINQKGFVNIILVVLVVILAGAVGYFVFMKKPAPIVEQITPPATTPPTNNTVSQNPPTTISQLTKAQVLNGFDQCGVQFSNGEISVGYDKYTQLERTCSVVVSGASMSADGIVFADLDGDSINEALVPVRVVRASSGGALYVFKNVNGVARAVDSIIFGKENGKIVSVNKDTVVVETDGAMGYTPHKETYEFVGNKLIKQSTSSSGTVDWKTCVNTKYGYEAKYPPTWKVWKPGAPEARLANCDENLAIIALSPNLFEYPISRITQVNIDVSDQERLRGTIYEGSKSLDDYFSKNPSILQNSPKVKETTIDGERLVWLEGNWLLSFHNDSIFDFRVYNVDNVTLDNFIRAFKFR